MSRKFPKAPAYKQLTQQTSDLQPESLETEEFAAQQPVSLISQISPIGNTLNPNAHAALVHRAAASPQSSQQLVLQLQRQYGNRYVNRVLQQARQIQTPIQAKLTLGAVGDKYEQQADLVAKQVVNQIQTSQSPSVQREMMPEEDELQMKPVNTIQREGVLDEENKLGINAVVQRSAIADEGAIAPDLEASIQQARGSGQALPENIRLRMEQAFGSDFSGVKIHTDAQSHQLNHSIQAKAFTTGQDIFFQQGEYNPGSSSGQELIAHELTHVVQQNMKVQRSAIADERAIAPDLEASIQQARGSGQALSKSVRQPMEQAFGADFSGVKIHTDPQSDQLNQSIQAKAFTTGQDIFFREGEYNPSSSSGQELIAHELTHVIQQTQGQKQSIQRTEEKDTNNNNSVFYYMVLNNYPHGRLSSNVVQENMSDTSSTRTFDPENLDFSEQEDNKQNNNNKQEQKETLEEHCYNTNELNKNDNQKKIIELWEEAETIKNNSLSSFNQKNLKNSNKLSTNDDSKNSSLFLEKIATENEFLNKDNNYNELFENKSSKKTDEQKSTKIEKIVGSSASSETPSILGAIATILTGVSRGVSEATSGGISTVSGGFLSLLSFYEFFKIYRDIKNDTKEWVESTALEKSLTILMASCDLLSGALDAVTSYLDNKGYGVASNFIFLVAESANILKNGANAIAYLKWLWKGKAQNEKCPEQGSTSLVQVFKSLMIIIGILTLISTELATDSLQARVFGGVVIGVGAGWNALWGSVRYWHKRRSERKSQNESV